MRTNEELEQDLKAVTDRLTALDKVIASRSTGAPKVMAFRCTHSGLFFPSFYAKEWGITTGIGLGPDVVSESLDTNYHVALPDLRTLRREEDLMYPVGNSMAQVDFTLVDEEEFQNAMLVLAIDDPEMQQRARILREKQLASPKGILSTHQAEYRRITPRRAFA